MAKYMDKAEAVLGDVEDAPLGHQESKRRLAFHEAAIYAQLAVAEQLAALVGLLKKGAVGLEDIAEEE